MSKDYGAKQTDKELAQLERRLATLYAESKAELEEAIDNYYNGWYEQVGEKTVYHAGLLQRKEAELEAFKEGKYHDPSGRYSDEEMFARWWWAQEGRGKELEKMRDDMARKMTETNQRAVAMINDKTPTIYALNANWEAYKIQVVRKNDGGKWIRENARRDFDNGTTLNVAFDLVKETTVKELVENKNHSEFRVNSINPKRDYDWNYDQIQKALLAGVMMGDSPYDIAKRYLTVMHRNRTASIRNARTSVTSAQNAGCQHTYERAVEKGIPIKKQWMSTMDKRTRESHILANGQIVDVKDKFKVGECKMEYPAHPDGNPEEVYNCRCTMVTVDPAVLNVNGDPYDVAGFKKWVKENRKDIKYPEDEQKEEQKEEKHGIIFDKPLTSSTDKDYNDLLTRLAKRNIDFRPIESNDGISEDEIIERLGGGDNTEGSCASLALAYIGQKIGLNVIDYRDGKSREFFSSSLNLFSLSNAKGVKALHYGDVKGKSAITLAKNFLETCEVGKEYYLCVGRHASIVRRTAVGELQYLELQSPYVCGWKKFNRNVKFTLANRFVCASSSGHGERWDFMMDVTDSDFNNDEFKSILGYINTAVDKQRKSESGSIK